MCIRDSVQLVAKDGPFAQLRMPSGEIRNVDVRCRATVGEVGNAEQSNINWGKAGRMRWKGKRPTVRGVAMNPIDHPHGGGEGKTSGGRHPVSPWGQQEGRTRKSHKESDKPVSYTHLDVYKRQVSSSHGAHRNHRKPGSIGGCATPGRVFKGMRMAGRMGGVRQTTQNLSLIHI